MKKIISSFFVLLALSASFVNAQTYSIYVSDIDVTTESPARGSIIDGTFNLYNTSDTPQADIYFTVSSGKYDEESLTTRTQHTSEKQGPFYMKAQSKDSIPFTYTLPKNLPAESAIQITARLKDGTLVGQGQYPITFVGESSQNEVSVIGSYLSISDFDEKINSLTGPTIYEGESLEFTYTLLSQLQTSSMTLTPTLKLYDRTNIQDNLVQTIALDPITILDTETLSTFSIDVPVGLDPLVYYGMLSFMDDEGSEILSTDFRYVVAGPIATVRNITTETLKVGKGDTFSITVTYGGQPLDEYRPEKQFQSSITDITIVAKNQKGEEIAKVTQELNLESGEKTLTIPLTAEKSAKNIILSATITTKEGTVLDSYETQLPSKKDLKDQESLLDNAQSKTLLIALFITLIAILSVLFFLKKKYKKLNIPTVVFLSLLVMSGVFFSVKHAGAGLTNDAATYLQSVNDWNDAFLSSSSFGGWKIIQAENTQYDIEDYEFGDNYVVDSFGVTAVTSPVSPKVKLYAPGEEFNLSFNATYGDCNNEGRSYAAYAFNPNKEWWTFDPKVDGNVQDRSAWWNTIETNRQGQVTGDKIQLVGLSNTSTWKETFLASDLKVISGITAAKEKNIKDIVRYTNPYILFLNCDTPGSEGYLVISNRCADYIAKLFNFNDAGQASNQDFVNWAKNNHQKLTAVQTIFRTNTQRLDDRPALKNYDFSQVNKLKVPVDSFTTDYISKMKALNQETDDYTKQVINEAYIWYAAGKHATELTPVGVSKKYTAPTTPGYHKMYFYMYQSGNSGQRDFTVVQPICVTGAGKCPNEPTAPVVTLDPVDQITHQSARINWKYTDKEGNKQVQYLIQVSTEQNFTDTSKIMEFKSGNGDSTLNHNIRKHVVTGLRANTLYYVRMKAKADAEPRWSEWSNIVNAASFTTINIPNQPHVTACSSVSNVTHNSARVNWTYFDADNDAQANYRVQIATDSGFTNIVKNQTKPDGSNASLVRNLDLTGLTASTTYYARVKTYNGQNDWGPFVNCSGSFRTGSQTYSITYNGNGNTGGTAPANQTKTHGVNITLANNTGNLAKTGSRFVGWNTSSAGNGTDYATSSIYSGNANLPLFAKWALNPINGSCSTSLNTCTAGTLSDTTDTTTQNRWSCVGLNGGTTASCATNKTTFTVSFDKNSTEAIGTMDPQSFTAGQTQNLIANAFSRNKGYTFDGWATTATGTKAYNNQASYTMSNPGANKKLFARWFKLPSPTNLNVVCSTNGTSITSTWTRATGYESIFYRVSPTSNLSDTTLWINDLKANSQTTTITPGVEYKVWIHTGVGDAYSTPALQKNITCPVVNSLSCTGGSYRVGEQSTYTATNIPGATYQWYNGSNLISGATSRIYSTTFNSEGSYTRTVRAIINGASQNTSCTATVTDTSCTGSDCGGGGGGGGGGGDGGGGGGSNNGGEDDAKLKQFEFLPNVGRNTPQTCPLFIEVENATSCRLVNRAGIQQNISWTNPIPTTFKIENRLLGVGTYTLSCVGTNNATTVFGSRACYSNPDLEEN